MSNKNYPNSNQSSDSSLTESELNKTSVTKPLPLPLPSRDEVDARRKSAATTPAINTDKSNNNSNNNNDSGDELADLINNIAVATNNGQNETNAKFNLTQKFINFVTKIKSQIYNRPQSILLLITKLSGGVKKLLQLLKTLPSYMVLKINDDFKETSENGNTDNVDKIDNDNNKIKNQNKKQTQINEQPKSETQTTQTTNKTITENATNIVTKNQPDISEISPSPAVDLYGDDNDIYEGFSWQDVLIKAAALAVCALLLIAGYIGFKSIFNAKSSDAIAINNPINPTDKNDTNTPHDNLSNPAKNSNENNAKIAENDSLTNAATNTNLTTNKTENTDYANNNATRKTAPSIDLPNPAIANNKVNPTNNNNQNLTETETNNEKINDITKDANTNANPPNPLAASSIFPTEIPPVTPPVANNPNDTIDIFAAISTPSNVATPLDGGAGDADFPNTPPASHVNLDATPNAPAITPPTENNSPFANILSDSSTSSATPTTSATNNKNTIDNQTQNNNQSDTFDTNKIAREKNAEFNINKQNENHNNEKSDPKSEPLLNEKSSEILNANQNTEMAPLNVVHNDPIFVTNNPPPLQDKSPASLNLDSQDVSNDFAKNISKDNAKNVDKNFDHDVKQDVDKNVSGKNMSAKDSANKDTELNELTSAPMGSLPVTESQPNILSGAESTLRVPSQEHVLESKQDESIVKSEITSDSKSDIKSYSFMDKPEESISVPKNNDSLAIIPDSKIQPRFTKVTPPVSAKSDITLPDMPEIAAMRTLQTVAPNEVTPSIPLADSVKPNSLTASNTTSNSEPGLRIPLELPQSQSQPKTQPQPNENINALISVAQNKADKTASSNLSNLPNLPASSSTDTVASPVLVFENIAANNRNDKSDVATNAVTNADANAATNNATNNVNDAKLFNETNNRVVDVNSASNEILLPYPVNFDGEDAKKLTALLPSKTTGEGEAADVISGDLLLLQDNAPAVIAESNPSYRRLPSSNPAAVQLQNAGNVLHSGAVTQVYREQLDREITRSPENAEMYTVKAGDTYMSICDNYYGTGLLYRALAVHNRNRGAAWIPAEGTQIEIPTADYLKTNYANILAKNNRYNKQNNTKNNATLLTQNNAITTSTATATSTQFNSNAAIQTNQNRLLYTVQKNDSIFKIAQDQLKDTTRWREIIKSNPDKLQSARDLKPGMQIVLPIPASTASDYKKLN
ncbi:MAG: LysM peptidoglycan-binding domain-containing protein [Planctomycetaceae bacterium]|jgi:nucleoid-associated protein YgaU|nr:LysM peptidoglycan-binding domain-containing protein [Planctomycetaceae bacterium]